MSFLIGVFFFPFLVPVLPEVEVSVSLAAISGISETPEVSQTSGTTLILHVEQLLVCYPFLSHVKLFLLVTNNATSTGCPKKN